MTATTGKHITAVEEFDRLLTPTDRLSTYKGDLLLDGCRAVDLVAEFGSPLYVVAEGTLRENYRRIQKAFSEAWSHPINILYAIKANNNLAIRAIMFQEGAGGDCFGTGELYATFMGGADPQKVVLNGSSKTRVEIQRAIELGIHINLDCAQEVHLVADVAEELGKTASVNIRLKLIPSELIGKRSDFFGYCGDDVWRKKFGLTVETAEPIIREIQSDSRFSLLGYDTHFGRFAREPEVFAGIYAAMAQMIIELRDRTGFEPRVINLGGGWARERDPESRALKLNPYTIEDYARAVCDTLLSSFEGATLRVPDLWLEPGRYIVGNAVHLLTTVGMVKFEGDHTWVNVDTSTNDLMQIEMSGTSYHIVPATRMDRPSDTKVDVVGHTCFPSVLGNDRRLPKVETGDLLAILDAGMYAETVSTQFNGVPRPATILVSEGRAEIIKERETVCDVFAKHRIPERIRVAKGGSK